MMAADGDQHDHRAGRADRHLVPLERVFVHEVGGQPGRAAGSAARQRHDEVVGLDGQVGQDDEGRQEHWPQHAG